MDCLGNLLGTCTVKTEGFKWILLCFTSFPLFHVFLLDIIVKCPALPSAVAFLFMDNILLEPSGSTNALLSASSYTSYANALITVQLLLWHVELDDEISYMIFSQESIFQSWNSGSIQAMQVIRTHQRICCFWGKLLNSLQEIEVAGGGITNLLIRDSVIKGSYTKLEEKERERRVLVCTKQTPGRCWRKQLIPVIPILFIHFTDSLP